MAELKPRQPGKLYYEKDGFGAHGEVPGIGNFGVDRTREQDIQYEPILDAKAERIRGENEMLEVAGGTVVGGFSGAGIAGGIGAGTGALVGGVVGSIIPGPGTAVGIAAGTAIGAGIGASIGGGAGLATGYAVTKHKPMTKLFKKFKDKRSKKSN